MSQANATMRIGLLPWAGLATALSWAASPVFIREGLEQLPSPLLGVTVGVIASTIAYASVLYLRRDRWRINNTPIPASALRFQLVAGVFVGLATWLRWVAIDLAPIATVLALGHLSVPVILVLGRFMLDQEHERATRRVWLGATLIVSGSLMLVIFRQ